MLQNNSLKIERFFTKSGIHPFDEVNWKKIDAIIHGKNEPVFEQKNVEFPDFYSQNAINIIASKYFKINNGKQEHSLRELINRVVKTFKAWGLEQGYFENEEQADIFENELTHIILHQKAWFNSPVWFNIGINGRSNQCSACFVLSVEDNMESILDWIKTEGLIFKGGSGSGINLSNLRAKGEPLSSGGQSSGIISFMKAADAVAGSIKSGGTTRRAAKMVILDIDHPEIMDFIKVKSAEENKIRQFIESGYDLTDMNNSLWQNIFFQNANNSVRIPDEFMEAVLKNKEWQTIFRKTQKPAHTYKAKDLLMEIAEAAWECGDPGVQFGTTIQKWNTCKNSGRINASNPCAEYLFFNNTSCNLSSINLLKYLQSDGNFDIKGFEHTIKIMFLAQDILIDKADYPTEKIGEETKKYRTIGLGYANLGALIMHMGLAYDSEEARSLASAITSHMTASAYKISAIIAEKIGTFSEFLMNKDSMLDVIKMHQDATKKITNIENIKNNPSFLPDLNFENTKNTENKLATLSALSALGNKISFIKLEDGIQVNEENLNSLNIKSKKNIICNILEEANNRWAETVEFGEKYGFRNAQVSLVAPTGTIGLAMDCDTTGIEPEFALVKTKQLVGGGNIKFVNKSIPLSLEKIGYTEEEIKKITEHLENTSNIETAPDIKKEHLPIFDTAIKPLGGNRIIHWTGHVKMVAAVQPFVSGGISKTFNVPAEATKEEIYDAYLKAWELGIKCFAIYRDNSKATQALYSGAKKKSGKIIDELQWKRSARKRLPDIRKSETHKFSISGHEGYLSYSFFEDGTLGEIFITMSKQGSTLAGLLDAFAIAISIALQYGVPLKDLVSKFIHIRFEPVGITINQQIKFASSIIDYIFKYLGKRFLTDDELAVLGLIEQEKIELKDHPKLFLDGADETSENNDLIKEIENDKNPLSVFSASEISRDNVEYDSSIENDLAFSSSRNNPATFFDLSQSDDFSNVADDFQHNSMELSGPPCKKCGGMTIRTGSCYSCVECGETNGGCG